MDRAIATQPDRFCAYYETSASADLSSFARTKALLSGAAVFLKGLSVRQRQTGRRRDH